MNTVLILFGLVQIVRGIWAWAARQREKHAIERGDRGTAGELRQIGQTATGGNHIAWTIGIGIVSLALAILMEFLKG